MFGRGSAPAHKAESPAERIPFRTANVAFAQEQEEAARREAAMHRLPIRTSENGPAPRSTDGCRRWTARRAGKVIVRVCIVLAAASAAGLLPRASSSVAATRQSGSLRQGDRAPGLRGASLSLRLSPRGLARVSGSVKAGGSAAFLDRRCRGFVPLMGLRLRGGQDKEHEQEQEDNDPVENHVRGFRARYLELFGVEEQREEDEHGMVAYEGGGDVNDDETPWGRHAEQVPEVLEPKAAFDLERQMTGLGARNEGASERSDAGAGEWQDGPDQWGNTVIDLTDFVEVGPQEDTDYYLELFNQKKNSGGLRDGVAHFAEEQAEDGEVVNASYLFDARGLTRAEGEAVSAAFEEDEGACQGAKQGTLKGKKTTSWGPRADAYLPFKFTQVDMSNMHRDPFGAEEEESKWGLYVDERGIGKMVNSINLNGSDGTNVSTVRVGGYLNDDTLNGSSAAGAASSSNDSLFAQRCTKYCSEDLSRLWMAFGSGLGLNGSEDMDAVAFNTYPSAICDDPMAFLDWIDSSPRDFVRKLIFFATDELYIKRRRFDERRFKEWCERQDVRYGGRACRICDADQRRDAPGDRIDHRLDVVLPDQYEHMLEGIQNLRADGRLVVKATAGDYAWDRPLVVSAEALDYTDYDAYMKEIMDRRMAGDTMAGDLEDDRYFWPDLLCHVHAVVLGNSMPLRVFGLDTSAEDEHDVGLGSYEGKAVRMWGAWRLERGSAGSFSGMQLLYNDTHPPRWEEFPNLALDENRSFIFPEYKTALPDSDLGELKSAGFEPVAPDFGCISHQKSWTPSDTDILKDEWSGYTAEPCVQVWEGPWLFSQCGIKCAAGTALLLGHEADVMAESCQFGGMGRGEFFLWEPKYVGRRCLEASYIVWAMHSGSMVMQGCTLIDSHSAIVKQEDETMVTMRDCTADGNRRGCFVSDNATLGMYNSSLLSLVRGALWPTDCENATLHIDSCRIQGPMWANETWARGLLTRRRLKLSGRANTFLSTEGLAQPAPRTYERLPRLVPSSVAPDARKGKFGHFYSMLGVDRGQNCTHQEHGSTNKVERERRARIETEAAVPPGDDSLFFQHDLQEQPGGAQGTIPASI